jgi:ribosomal protein S17E
MALVKEYFDLCNKYQNEYGEEFEEAKVELVSHVCAQAVSENRLKNKLT